MARRRNRQRNHELPYGSLKEFDKACTDSLKGKGANQLPPVYKTQKWNAPTSGTREPLDKAPRKP